MNAKGRAVAEAGSRQRGVRGAWRGSVGRKETVGETARGQYFVATEDVMA